MSDCSTNAMKPKMPPKTCGTCQHQRYCHMPAESRFAEACARFRPEGEPTVPKYAPISETCDACPERIMEDGCKVKARCYDLEQRCQQLEQVTKELFDAYRRLLACYRGAVGIFNAQENATSAGKFRERLESVGVSVDG